MKAKNIKTKLGQGLIQGLSEALAWQEGKLNLNSTQVELIEEPPEFSKSEIKKIREALLKVSQPVFAKLLGVSDKAVKAWEQGLSKPSGSSARMLQLAQKQPDKFTDLIMSLSH